MRAVTDGYESASGSGSGDQPPIGAISIQPGAVFGDLELERKIGQGAQGVVYLGRQVSVNRRIAIKILPKDLAFTQEQVDRFQREGKAAGRLNHPNIVSVYGLEESGGHHLIMQEFVEGGSLEEVLKERTKEGHHTTTGDCTWAAGMCRQLAQALDHAHRHGVVHRDMKPGNVLLTINGVPKITDFGLAHVDDNLGLSRTGAVMGTPHYMSPEQVQAHPSEIDARTDVYGLGALLYHMLAGEVLFHGDSVQAVFLDILTREPRPLRKLEPGVSSDLEAVCLKALEKDPEDRYQTGQEFADDLDRYLKGEPTLARPVSFVGRSVRHMRRLATSTLAVVALLVPTAWLAIDALVLKADAVQNADMHYARVGLVVTATLLLTWPLSLIGVRLAKGNPKGALPAWLLVLALGGFAGWQVHDQRLTQLHHADRTELYSRLRLEQPGDRRVVDDLEGFAEQWGARFDPDDQWLMARGFLKRQRPVQAEEWALRLAESKSDSPVFHALLSAINDMLGRDAEADASMREIERTAGMAEGWFDWKQIGDIWRDLDRFPDALDAYQRAGRMANADRDRLNLDMALVLADLCQWKESDEYLRDFMKWNETDPTAHQLALGIAMDDLRWDEAQEHLTAFEANADIAAQDKILTRVSFLRRRADAHSVAGETEAAAQKSAAAWQHIRDAQKRYRRDPEALSWCAQQWFEKAKLDRAYADYYASIEDTVEESAFRESARKLLGDAQNLFIRVRDLVPEAAYPLVNLLAVELAWADLEPDQAEQRLKAAVRYAERAVELDPNYFQAHYMLGATLWRQARFRLGVSDTQDLPLAEVQAIAEAQERSIALNGLDLLALNDAGDALSRIFALTGDRATLDRCFLYLRRAVRLMERKADAGCGLFDSDRNKLSAFHDTLSHAHEHAGDLDAALAASRASAQALNSTGDAYAPHRAKRAERVAELKALVEGGS